jgi:hypothetical protein
MGNKGRKKNQETQLFIQAVVDVPCLLSKGD